MDIHLPEKFKQDMEHLLGEEEYHQYLDSFSMPQNHGFRVNTLRWSPEEFRRNFPYQIDPIPWIPNGFFYDGKIRLSKDPYYYSGLIYLQEPSAMTPAALLPVEPGDMVLDLCAAPGGKSTELGAKLNGKGMLLANDISNSRAKALLKNLELFGIANICVTSELPERLAAVFPDFFDKILVDAPCSGEGMFRKEPDMVKNWNIKGPEYYSPIQKTITAQAVTMLKKGGYLLYSTCTFSRAEDEDVIQWILSSFPEMELVPIKQFPGSHDGIGLSGCLRLFPHAIRGEGHFAALLKKSEKTKNNRETHSVCPKFQPEKTKQGKETNKHIRSKNQKPEKGLQFMESQLEKEVELWNFLKQTKLSWETNRIVKIQEQIYYLPDGFQKGTGLRYLRTGLLMGTLKKGRFEPSQAMAMVLNEHLYANCISFDREDARVIRYLKGETIFLSENEQKADGWCLVCVDGFALGFAKSSGLTLKNKYYPGWRWQ